MTTAAGVALTRLQYRTQLALRSQAVRDAAALWRVFTPGDRASWDRLTTLATPVVEARHEQSAIAAARYFEALAVLETGRFQRGIPAAALPVEQIEASLAATGLVGVVRARSVGLSPQAASAVGLVRFTGGFTRLALMGGRTTILRSVADSRLAKGWARVTSGHACAFCSMLADRGPVYSEETAGFAAHDHCSCAAVPVFDELAAAA